MKFIAEVSSNHQQRLDRALAFVDTAAQVGCDAVKFQLFKINELFAPEILSQSKEHARRRKWELPLAFIPPIANRCREKGVEFGCTPFYLDAVNELAPFVDFFKIASYELLWTDLFQKCAQTQKPVMFSTGIGVMEEIVEAVNALKESQIQEYSIFHCVSSYPTLVEDCHLAVIDTFKKMFGCTVGWSDHSVNPQVIYRAVGKWRADLVEFHLDLDGNGAEYAGGHCWLPEEIAPVIANIRAGNFDFSTAAAADGQSEKICTLAEQEERLWRADPADGLRPFKSKRLEY